MTVFNPTPTRQVRPYRNRNRVSPWTPEKVRQLLDVTSSAERNSAEIAQLLGTTKNAVISRLNNMGIRKPRKGQYPRRRSIGGQ